MMVRLIALVGVLVLASCASKPTFLDPPRSGEVLKLEEYFDGRLQASGQFVDVFGTVQRSFDVDIVGDWDGDRLQLVEDFVYEDGATEQRIWTLRKTGADTWEGTAPGVIGVARGVVKDERFNWRYEIDLPVPTADGPTETIRVTFNDWMWQLSETELLNEAYMQRWGVDVGVVTIRFTKLD